LTATPRVLLALLLGAFVMLAQAAPAVQAVQTSSTLAPSLSPDRVGANATLTESVLLLAVGCTVGAVFGLYGQQLADRALAHVVNFPSLIRSPTCPPWPHWWRRRARLS
jgi:hypothetical protein